MFPGLSPVALTAAAVASTLAGGAMALSSVSVVTSSLLLGRWRPMKEK